MTHVHVRIDVPRGAFTKARRDGTTMISPVPMPFDYGEIVGSLAADGDAIDAIVLGRSERGPGEGTFAVRGVVRFVDAGQIDDKYVVGAPPSAFDLRLLRTFFFFYAAVKRIGHRLGGQRGPTAFLGYSAVDRL